MKTSIKITAIALITVLTVLACSEDARLTPRDYGTRNEASNAGYTNATGNFPITHFIPSITADLSYNESTQNESRKEIKITFPKNADILKVSNVNMTDKLTEFLNLFHYSNPAVSPAVYTPSTIGSDVPYSFVRRDGNAVIIKLDSIPNTAYIEAKFDASNYRCSGQVLDFNKDGIGGESYDDLYADIRISGGNTITGYTNEFYRPEQVKPINLSIKGPAGGAFTAANASRFITIIDSDGNGDNNAYMRKILSDLIPNIEFQKYNQTARAWVKEETVTLYEYTETSSAGFPAVWDTDRLYVMIDTPEDLGIYRVKATGLTNLTTRDNYGATSKPAKITIDGKYHFNDYYTNHVSYYNDDIRYWVTANPVNNVIVKSDANRKNVVLELYFNRIIDNKASIPSDVWLEQISTEQFNECVKLVYHKDDPGSAIPSGNDLTAYDDLVGLKITDVTYSTSRQFDATVTYTNCITITLDPSYRISGERAISLLLSPGFKYTGGHVTFGDSGNGDIGKTYYNGTFFWRSYGRLGTINL